VCPKSSTSGKLRVRVPPVSWVAICTAGSLN
jgi:hypothetical protein